MEISGDCRIFSGGRSPITARLVRVTVADGASGSFGECSQGDFCTVCKVDAIYTSFESPFDSLPTLLAFLWALELRAPVDDKVFVPNFEGLEEDCVLVEPADNVS